MASKIWVILFVAFSAFSWMVYSHCDDNNREGMPNQQVVDGWKLWQDKNCQGCHQLYGLGGYLGPDVTNTMSEPGKGPLYMQTLIKYGTGRMPNYNLNDTEVNHLVSFLAWVDKSGKSKIPQDAVHWSGTYKIR